VVDIDYDVTGILSGGAADFSDTAHGDNYREHGLYVIEMTHCSYIHMDIRLVC